MREKTFVRPQRGRPPLSDAERKRILDAMTDVFLERGFESASTSEIARRARTSKQTLYGLFPTKADMFVAVMSAQTEELYGKHMEYIASSEPPAAVLHKMGMDVLQLFSAPRFLPLYRNVVGAAERFPELARQFWQTSGERGYALLGEYLRTRRIGGPDYRKSAVQFAAMVLGDLVFRFALVSDLQWSEAEMQERVQDAVKDFLRLHVARDAKGQR